MNSYETSATVEAEGQVHVAGVPFAPGTEVAITISPKRRTQVKPAVSRVRQTAGLIGWTGSQEDADFIATSPELDPQEDE